MVVVFVDVAVVAAVVVLHGERALWEQA